MTIALTSMFAFAAPVFAQTQNDEAIKADVQSLDKDNANIHSGENTLAHNRAAKAADKVNGDAGKQAVDSLKIGADKAGIEAQKVKKDVDEKILAHHKEGIKADDAASKAATVN